MRRKHDHQQNAILSQELEAKRVVAGLLEPIDYGFLGEAGTTSGFRLPICTHTSSRTYGKEPMVDSIGAQAEKGSLYLAFFLPPCLILRMPSFGYRTQKFFNALCSSFRLQSSTSQERINEDRSSLRMTHKDYRPKTQLCLLRKLKDPRLCCQDLRLKK